ncbi:RiPP maturation radical SAM C-methyltransferase [Polyangium sorediatum]|uniref:RiPP maturation radical SAM C-methyltransferase n=1 Tax=Polyangium sorediatum TaxID=889274 RepID=A0ABT6NYL6_9BACT|nr:RiPP maturation radical SAM C-methyltransferase [Polyangium sorediatum]MDI1433383.1 RiPP maturation radical SAM C-methyltransferase [Polyangium sorediatum]
MKQRGGNEKMYEIKLVNMPFAAEHLPSLALTQLRAVVKSELGERVSVENCYLNLDVARHIGSIYHEIEDSMVHLHTGLGDWLFRGMAFPEVDDNADAYFSRCYPHRTPERSALMAQVVPMRKELDRLLDELLEQYRLHEADLIGFSSIFIQNVASLAMARKIKARAPHVITVMGGPNCEYPMGAVLVEQAPQIDFAFSGPALKSFPQFVKYILDGEPERCQEISGVISRKNLDLFVAKEKNLVLAKSLVKVGSYFPSKRVKVLEDGDVDVASAAVTHAGSDRPVLQQVGEELPLDYPIELDYDAYLDEFERKLPDAPAKPTLLLETSRGCWWGERSHCTFCGLNDLTLGYRAMTVDRAVAEFDKLFRYEGRASRLLTVDVIIPKEFISDVLPRLKTPPSMEIFYEVKSSISEEDVQRFANARVKVIQPGVEALATSTLRLLKKGATAFQSIALLKNCTLHDVIASWNLLIGVPGEKEEVYRKYAACIPLLMHLPPPSDALQVRFDRFSPYFNYAKDYGLKLAPMDHYGMIYPFDPSKIVDMAYFFRDENYESEYFVYLAKWFSEMRSLIAVWQQRWPITDPKARAELYVRKEGEDLVIRDSRSGHTAEYPITRTTWAVLRELEKPMSADRVADLLRKTMPELDIGQEIAFMTSKGLLFEEDGRYLSLVLPCRPPYEPEADVRRMDMSRSDTSQARTVLVL